MEHLDRDKSAEVGLPTPVDSPRAALADALQHLVASVQLPPDERIGGIERISDHERRLYIVERRPDELHRQQLPGVRGRLRVDAILHKPFTPEQLACAARDRPTAVIDIHSLVARYGQPLSGARLASGR